METLISQTPLSQVIINFENKNLTKFTPDKRFYTHIGINRIRFWQIVRGQKPLLATEARTLSEYFKVPLTDLI
ncbi:hypothetical protein D0T08_14485 [Emticicia sp. C21]|nr:hypothetical protein D0T08_14485 [Emticicia sp. C21]